MTSPAFAQTLTLASPEATTALARRLGAVLRPGDVILMSGDIGAGKTHFARSLIQSLLAEPEDVPSPTFTLVQEYDTLAGPVWHADLYRLSDPLEAIELGLEEAFADAICLIEWPDRLGDLAPEDALCLDFAVLPDQEEGRRLNIRAETIRNDIREALADGSQ